MKKMVYLIDTFKEESTFALGLSLDKPYPVLDEAVELSHEINTRINKYKISDDYGNLRWVNSNWFLEYKDWRDEKIKRLLE